MKVVIVESPAKAKTINKYLGNDYKVLASYGHIRDLPPKDGSVNIEQNFEPVWQMDVQAENRVKDIVKALKGADALYLATDPDREGEAISWHVYQVLKTKKALNNIPVKRAVFNQINKAAVVHALKNVRDLDQNLIDAYLARRVLDYLVGFTLSPVLWRKLPGSRSAGRVQSVALRLIVEREVAIEAFKTQEYWSIWGDFSTSKMAHFSGRLFVFDNKKLEKLSVATKDAAEHIVETVQQFSYKVVSVEKKRVRRTPPPPFTTSTLQQEASRKLGFGAQRTMQTAQKLYEGITIDGETTGLITYMRTDSIQVASNAVQDCRSYIGKTFGTPYVPEAERVFKSKVKNAQEAHEAIRPTDFSLPPEKVAAVLDPSQLKLYELIWKRMVASQMANAEIDQTTIEIFNPQKTIGFKTTGSVIAFDGFLKLYEEGQDTEEEKDDQALLPAIHQDEPLGLEKVIPKQHFTQPPPRYSEASLVKQLEELGIGRPSTYASILQVLQVRQYVRLEKRVFIPEDRGRIVTCFLTNFFDHYFQYNFTATLEQQLDEISNGEHWWVEILQQFWTAFKAAIDATKTLKVSDVLERLDEELGSYLFPQKQEGIDPRQCPQCKEGKLSLKLGKFGAFVGCSHYPECNYTTPIGGAEKEESAEGGHEKDTSVDLKQPKVLGIDPISGQDISLRTGPYGPYVQIESKTKTEKPKRMALPKGTNPETFTFEQAVNLLALPRALGKHPETGEDLSVGIGRFGPFIKQGNRFISLKEGNVLEITLDQVLKYLENTASTSSPAEKKPYIRKTKKK